LLILIILLTSSVAAMAFRTHLLPLLLSCAFALPGIASAQANLDKSVDLRGFALETSSGLVFTRCGSNAPLEVQDKSPDAALTNAIAAVRPVMSQQDRPIYVELRGSVAGKTVTANRLYRVIGHVADCSSLPTDLPPNVLLAATGTDAPWGFVATPAQATLRRLNLQPVRFAGSAFAKPSLVEGNTRTFDAWSQLDGGTLRIQFTEGLCLNLNAEAAYGASVIARLGAQTFQGCAIRY
jgi:hypothetical protein